VISEILEDFNENQITTMCFIDLQKNVLTPLIILFYSKYLKGMVVVE